MTGHGEQSQIERAAHRGDELRQRSLRIIPRLDIKGPNLVKGIHLEGLRVLGKPERFSRLYYEAGADELLFIDIVASLYGRAALSGSRRSPPRAPVEGSPGSDRRRR